MSWRKIAYLDEVATLSNAAPQDVKKQTASAGTGTAASRDDHKHNLDLSASPLNELADPTGEVEFAKQALRNPVIDPQATAPSTPVDGQVYYNTADDHPYVYVAT